MKQFITKFFSRMALVAVVATVFAGTVWADTYSMTPDQASTGSSATSYITTLTNFTHGGISWAMNQWNPSTLQIKTNQASATNEFRFYNTTAFSGRISQVVIKFQNLTVSDSSGFMFLGGTSPQTGTTGGTAGTWNSSTKTLTWTPGASDNFTYFAFYQNGKVATGTNKLATTDAIVVTYEQSSSSAVATTTTINAAGITNTDVYTNTSAGSLSATVKDASNNTISGASVTWRGSNDNVATINASTGAVTLVSAGSVTFTATYAGVANQYQESSATYQMTVTDSTPFAGGDVTFDAARERGSSPLVKNGVTFSCDNGVLDNGSEYRLYKNSVSTFSVSDGVITQIVFTGVSGNPASGFDSQTGWTTSGNDGTWTGSANSVSFTASGAQVRATQIVVTVDLDTAPDPTISAADVSIAHDATSGSITYTINDAPTPAGTLTASTSSNWLTLGTVTSSVPFTCTANELTTARTATVTLTYTYGDNETVTKDVTVTQAAAPVIYTTIPTLFNAATSTSTSVNITFGSWVISAVKGNNAYLTDNQGNGLIIYQNQHGFAVNDVLTGTVTCNLVLYQGSAELTGLTSSTQGLTVTSNGSVTEQTIAISELGGVNTGALVAFEGLTYNGSALVDGNSNTITPYTSLYNFGSTFVDGISYDVKGIYVQFNTTKEILPRSSADIEEVQSQSPVIVADDVELEYNATSGEIAYTVHNPTSGSVSATPSAAWISNVTVTAEKVTFTTTANETNADRTATFTLTYPGAENKTVTVTQKHFVADYATLPFSFDGGRDDIANTVGLTQEGLDSDYGSSPKLKFNSADDWVILKFNEAPGTLSFDVKGNPGGNPSIWAGTFKVQTSSDGETFTDLKTYDDLTSTVLSESFSNLDQNVRYIKWVYASKTSGNVALGNISLEQYVSPDTPSITVDPATVNASYAETDGTISVTYNNITTVLSDIVYYTSAAATQTTSCPEWLEAEINASNNLYYVIGANSDSESRTAYLKVWAYDDNEDEVYSELITITQAAFVVDYAVLPFEWAGGTKSELEALTGVTTSGLGSDYAESNAPYRVKFDSANDYIQIKTDSRPGKVTLDVKMLGGGDESKITIQESSNGSSFTDVQVYTVSGAQNDELSFETTTGFAASSRYVRIIKTVHGSNVGIGPITITQYSSAPSISISNDEVNVLAAETDGYLAISYENLDISAANDFGVQFYDLQGEEINDPDWIGAEVTTQVGQTGYFVYYAIEENSGEARTAYFKVFAMAGQDFVYSNLVTITQAAPVAPVSGDEYTLYTGALVEGDYIIYYNGKAMNNVVNSNRLQYEEVTPVNDVITTSDASIVWHIASSGEYWTLYSPDVDKYAASTGAASKAQMLADGTDDKSLWTVSGTSAFDIVNKGNTAGNVNATLRNNTTYGFACYAPGTGGALSLYKRSDAPATITLTGTLDKGRYWTTFFNSAERYTLPDGAMAFTMNSDHELYRLGSNGKVIPANTAVVIMSDAQSITLTKSNSTSPVTVNGGANILRGSNYSIEAANLSGTPHVMGKVNNALGYYEYSGASIPAMKAYYKVNE